MRSSLKASAAIAISIAIATALGACSLLSPSAPEPTSTPTQTETGQSVSEACEALESELLHVRTEMNQAAEILNTETGAAGALLFASAFRLDFMATEELENDEVIEVTLEVSERIMALSELLTAAGPDPMNADAEAIDEAGADVNAAFAAFTEVCPEKTDAASAACDELAGDLEGVGATLSEASELLSNDPAVGAGILAEAASGFEKAAGAVENATVGALATEASDRLNEFSVLINALAADPANPDEAALSAGSAALNAAFNELGSFCAG